MIYNRILFLLQPLRRRRRHFKMEKNLWSVYLLFPQAQFDWPGPSLPWFIPWLLVTCLPLRSFISSCCLASRKLISSSTKDTRTWMTHPTAPTLALGWVCSKQRSVIMTWVCVASLAELTFQLNRHYLLISWLFLLHTSVRSTERHLVPEFSQDGLHHLYDFRPHPLAQHVDW